MFVANYTFYNGVNDISLIKPGNIYIPFIPVFHVYIIDVPYLYAAIVNVSVIYEYDGFVNDTYMPTSLPDVMSLEKPLT